MTASISGGHYRSERSNKIQTYTAYRQRCETSETVTLTWYDWSDGEEPAHG